MTRYMKALDLALNQKAVNNNTMTADQIKQSIADISQTLRGPLDNNERLSLVADRAELRATLRELEAL